MSWNDYDRWARALDRARERCLEKYGVTLEEGLRKAKDAGFFQQVDTPSGGVVGKCPRCGEVFYSAGPYGLPPVSPWRDLEIVQHWREGCDKE